VARERHQAIKRDRAREYDSYRTLLEKAGHQDALTNSVRLERDRYRAALERVEGENMDL
jgi:hypothetical protein